MNVEGLGGIGKHDLLVKYMNDHEIDVLAMQETRSSNIDSYTKDGFVFYFSGNKTDTRSGVGFIVSKNEIPRAQTHAH